MINSLRAQRLYRRCLVHPAIYQRYASVPCIITKLYSVDLLAGVHYQPIHFIAKIEIKVLTKHTRGNNLTMTGT